MSLPSRVTIYEVGPRDGLQNEHASIPTRDKIRFVEALGAAGLPLVETTAFVHPQAVPQMADAAEVVRGVTPAPDTRYVVLVPNLRGYARAVEAGAQEVAVFTAASETFSQRNTRCSIGESLTRIREVTSAAQRDGVPVRGYISTAWHCPYEGRVDPDVVAGLTQDLLAMGVWQVSLGDTIGAATPGEVAALLEWLLTGTDTPALALHCHDTRGTALANVLVGLQHGVSTIDASAGGLGGCPFAPGAAGNLATEDLVYMLDGMGIASGVSLTGVAAASALIEPALDHPLTGRTFQALRSSGAVQPSAA
jgi:isopropylmalate/homocitrate/citramalate synthase